MSNLQRIVSVLPSGNYNHNVLRNAILCLGAAIESRGLEHLILDGNQQGFQRNLLRHAIDPGCALYLGHRFFDLGLVHAGERGDLRRNLFEVIDRPVFALVLDHPYSEFMWSRIENASSTTHFLSPTPEFVAETQLINPGLVNFHRTTPTITELEVPDSEIRPLAEREIDIFMPCAFYTTLPSLGQLRQKHASAESPMKNVIDEVVEIGRADRDRSLLVLFRGAFERHMGEALSFEFPMTAADREVMQVLSTLDNRIRFERRIQVLRNLASLDAAYRIAVTMDPAKRELMPELQSSPNIELTDRIEAEKARQFFLSSKFVVNVNPTYVQLVSERVRNAMAFGCCVISDRSQHAMASFSEGEEILFTDNAAFAALNRFFRTDLEQAQAIATRARQKVLTEFPVSRMADDLIAVMRSVL